MSPRRQPAPGPAGLADEQQVVGIAATEVPATEVPATEVPATEVPASEVPATGVPAAGVPTAGLPEMGSIPVASRQAKKALPTRIPSSQQRRSRPRPGPAAPDWDPAADWSSAAGPAIAQRSSSGLSARLMAIARMIQIGAARSGRDGFSKKLLSEAEDVLGRAGERMRLSAGHTVVVLAGGTGSGKSALFNRLAGADFSTVGVTRPVTMDAHACIWGDARAGALVDWLGVPARNRYSRASALGKGEADLAGLVLLDLPDHDSVLSHAVGMVNRLVGHADVMIWVLDPQKYADAAVHRRFLVPLAGHSDVLAVVLNQSDLLDAAQIDDCVGDLRRLLDSENLHDVPILVTSALTGSGLDELRRLLAKGVASGRAAAARISADVDGVVAKFEPYAGDTSKPVAGIPAGSKDELVEKFAAAAGVSAVSDTLRSARELRAMDFVGWPVAWLLQRLTGRDPLRKVRLGMLWNDLRSVTAGPSGAQQAAIDNALTELGDRIAESLPDPWSQTITTATRSRAERIPAAVGAALGAALPAEDSVPAWWRLVGLWQGVLLGALGIAIAWIAAIVAFGVFHAASGGVPAPFRETGWLPWAGVAAVVALVLGFATSSVCMSLVKKTAAREQARIALDMRGRIASIASEMAIVPAEQELGELDRFREELRIASQSVDAGQRN